MESPPLSGGYPVLSSGGLFAFSASDPLYDVFAPTEKDNLPYGSPPGQRDCGQLLSEEDSDEHEAKEEEGEEGQHTSPLQQPFFDYLSEQPAPGDAGADAAWSPIPGSVATAVLDDFDLEASVPALVPAPLPVPLPLPLPNPQQLYPRVHAQNYRQPISIPAPSVPGPAAVGGPALLQKPLWQQETYDDSRLEYLTSQFSTRIIGSKVDTAGALGHASVTLSNGNGLMAAPVAAQSGANSNTSVCRFFLQGFCSRGDRCKFSHTHPCAEPAAEDTSASLASRAVRAVTGSDDAKQYPPIEQLVGQIYQICQDQYGCRYLQKKLDEGDAATTNIVFAEVVEHTADLMADPFGNYLCQKLLEHCTEWQRLRIVQTVAKDLDNIAVNMHGTRAVQKLIDYLRNPDEIALVREALKPSVVLLIQDLNGNHVIQRCLHALSYEDKQFIYDAVTESDNIVEVATHRHGCCVLQRCIDHASDSQKRQIVDQVVKHSLQLVKDPFGNYVVQYILDLPFDGVVCNLARQLAGHVVELSMQKFSSNVIEKLVQFGDREASFAVIQELVDCRDITALLQDPFANYVVQTTLSFADPAQHRSLVEKISPHLSLLRNTPYGKRIQSKVMKENVTQDKKSHGHSGTSGGTASSNGGSPGHFR
eukprot:TRINITY_DN5393_c0_g1_i1.p1 TRINITY_DN5393_c0_g1~~TRINITY_DN5393_c0_g1_i1.p1  ORF type:complete len:648 (+),score=176.61 TRINITY_DN5393_c0_g1_i1:83-2026(+)